MGATFRSAEFRQLAKNMAISLEKYRSRRIIVSARSNGTTRLSDEPTRSARRGPTTNPKACLQMAVKAVNDTAGLDGLVPTPPRFRGLS